MKYVIEIPEVHKARVEIEAPEKSSQEVILALANAEFEENGSNDLEYSHTLEQDEWTIFDEEGDPVDFSS